MDNFMHYLEALPKIERIQNQEHSAETTADSPFEQFSNWFDAITEINLLPNPNAAVLGTSSKGGSPSTRTVLIKQFGNDGFSFYTNLGSHKSRDLIANPYASMTIYWPFVEQQIHIVGTVEPLPIEESEAYFASRPRNTQIGAWASLQGSTLKNRDELEQKYSFYEKNFDDEEVPLPSHWGGFKLEPTYMEFWQAQSGRLHDRVVYEKSDKGEWLKKVVAP